jgi:Family of unknown function (DUF5906)
MATPQQSNTLVPASNSDSAATRPQLTGGVLTPNAALELMNLRFFVSEVGGEVSISRVENDGTLTHFGLDDFQLLLSNTFVDVGNKHIPIIRFWLAHPARRTCKIVFEPTRQIQANEYNLFRGFAITPRKGYQKQRRLLRHIWQIICKRDKAKFKYMLRWLAWSVQNPDRQAEVVVVLMSEAEGCGKSTVGQVMLDIFGQGKGRHGLLVDHKDQLLGKFNSHLETTCFALGEEVLWAGDHSTADALKSRITASKIPIEEKYRHRREVPNRLHVMLTTNHAWAVSAGVQARRYFVVEVSDEVAQDKSWFDPLYRDLKDGGTSEFLNFLLTLKLGNWHPREVPKTTELAQQQLLSAGSIEQWLLACAETDAVIGKADISSAELGSTISTQELYEAYSDFIRRRGARPEGTSSFGKVLTKICGRSMRLPANLRGKRPPGYSVPDAIQLFKRVHSHLKIGP